jgi:hypothetical protein
MTLEKAQKNLAAMASINRALIALGNKKAKKVLSMLLQAYSVDKNVKDEIKTINFCIRKLDELDHAEIEATLKYLIDVHVRAEFIQAIEPEAKETKRFDDDKIEEEKELSA